MLSFRRMMLLAAAMLMMAAALNAQPALTTIEDILYLANGTRFNGTMVIQWNAFQAGDTSEIATQHVTLPIVNGVLKVQLVPTTVASAGANYQVTYNSQGQFQFSQTWAVPPSSVALRIRDVLVGTGTVVGPTQPQPDTTPIQISDVVGLTNELALVPNKGVGYTLGRAAIINSSGQIDGAAGNLGDCVRVDGSSGPCGSNGGGILPLYSDGEVPSGAINGTNTTFTLAFSPSPSASLQLFVNGLLMEQGFDYSLSSNTVTFFAASTPQTGDVVQASYRYANPNNPLGSLTSPQVICSNVGSSTSSTSATTLGTCTIPAGLLGTGDRIEVRYQYTHTGTTSGFTPQVLWAGNSVYTRGAFASDTGIAGRMEFAVVSGAQPWSGSSWGSTLSFATILGSASADTTQNLTISFQGQMAGSTSDAVALSNFTVVRYPAQVNP